VGGRHSTAGQHLVLIIDVCRRRL